MRISGGLKSVRELWRMLKTDRCLSRFIYPDTYSPVSAVQLNVLPPLAKCPGVKGSRSGEGTIKRIGVTYAKAKHTSGTQRTTPPSIDLDWKRANDRSARIPRESCGLS